jgi:hypothetical protein
MMNYSLFWHFIHVICLMVIIVAAAGFNYVFVSNAHAQGDSIIGIVMRKDYPNQQALVNMFLQYLDPNDYVFGAYGDAKYAGLLPGIKVVTWTSLAAIQSNAPNFPTLKSKYGVSVIGYDLEQALSPASDLNNPVGSMQKASQIVHSYGMKFLATPGYPFINPTFASQVSPYSDSYIIQATCLDGNSNRYHNAVTGISNAIKTANPYTIILSGLSLGQASVTGMEQCWSLVAPNVHGVWVWYTTASDQVNLLNQFFSWFHHYYG